MQDTIMTIYLVAGLIAVPACILFNIWRKADSLLLESFFCVFEYPFIPLIAYLLWPISCTCDLWDLANKPESKMSLFKSQFLENRRCDKES